ncbi:hypothetical protein HUU53_01630 [Candidatus Micrarchaeota archaeon]|nr:hypothetical protein [Candidatus Micrarchaeota archaeon]
MLNLRDVWNEKYVEVKKLKLKSSVFSLITASEKQFFTLDESLFSKHPFQQNDFLDALSNGLFKQVFLEPGEFSAKSFRKDSSTIQGDAGVVVNHFARMGCEAILYSPYLAQGDLLEKKVKIPSIVKGKFSLGSLKNESGVTDFEVKYAMGQKVSVGGKVIQAPRSNKVLFKTNRSFEFIPEELLKKGKKQLSAKVIFLSGFEWVSEKKQLKDLEKQLALLPKTFIHWEYSPLQEKVAKDLLPLVLKHVDSIALNERELIDVLNLIGLKALSKEIEAKENAFTIYQGCLKLLEKFKLKRVHCHNLGYHVCVLSKKMNPDKTRDALTAASLMACVAAEKNTTSPIDFKNAVYEVSETGLNQVWIFESGIDPLLPKKHSSKDRKAFLARGWVELKDYYAVIVPTPIVQAKVFDGLGAIASATALGFEKS